MTKTAHNQTKTSASDPAAVANQPSAPATPAPSRADANPFTVPNTDVFSGAMGPINPFAAGAALSAEEARREALRVPDDAPEGTYTYSLVKSGPDVRSEEVERAGVRSVEVMVLWGTNVLHVSHLTPPRSFYVGEDTGQRACDFFLPSERIGATRMPVVLVDGENVSLVLPPGAQGTVELPGQAPISIEQARSRAAVCTEIDGGHALPLNGKSRARVELEGFVFQISTVDAGKRVPHGLAAKRDYAVASYFGLSLLTHASVIAALAFFVPDMGILQDEDADQSKIYTLQAYLKAAAEREKEFTETEDMRTEDSSESAGGTGERSQGSEGKMGSTTTKNKNGTYGVKGPKDNPDTYLARTAALREAREFGMIGLLNTLTGSPDTPTAPWGQAVASGADDKNAMGNMFGSSIAEAAGSGGLGLSGVGEGGGGYGEGIGLDTSGGLGRGAGGGWAQGIGPGGGAFRGGRIGPDHVTRTPKVRPEGVTGVSGRLPPEVIQRIVRQNFGRFRMCYEQGLARNPNLEGRVSVRFVIDSTGAVANATNGGSDIPDSGVAGCVISAFYGLSFPAPDGGIVTVTYPIMFQPG